MRLLFLIFIPLLLISCSELPTQEQTDRYEKYRQVILAHPAAFEADTIHGGDSLIRSLASDDLATVVRKNKFNRQQVEDYLKAMSIAADLVHLSVMMDSTSKSLNDFDSAWVKTDSLFKDSILSFKFTTIDSTIPASRRYTFHK